MSGAFIVSRDIFENPIWLNQTEFRLFFLILGKAVWKEEGKQMGEVHLQKGQWLRSYRNLQSDLEYVENKVVKRPGLATVKRSIDKLVKDGRITIKQVEYGTLFTVCNYCKYQDLNTYKERTRNAVENSDGTVTEQSRNNKNKDKKENKDNIYTPEFEKWYSEWPRPQAKSDSFRNFEKVRKAKGLDYCLMCTRNYLNWLKSQADSPMAYASNNFFGQKAYYLDYEQPKVKLAPVTNFVTLDDIRKKGVL